VLSSIFLAVHMVHWLPTLHRVQWLAPCKGCWDTWFPVNRCITLLSFNTINSLVVAYPSHCAQAAECKVCWETGCPLNNFSVTTIIFFNLLLLRFLCCWLLLYLLNVNSVVPRSTRANNAEQGITSCQEHTTVL
jgi:hypothetical protein